MTQTKTKHDCDYEKENNKKCPVCMKPVNYHFDGFISYFENGVCLWIHRDHTVKETEKALKRPLTKKEKNWILHDVVIMDSEGLDEEERIDLEEFADKLRKN